MDDLFLIAASFLTSTLTATIGLGGGVLLVSVMPGLLPAAAIVPVHGAVQLASNASRVLLGLRHVDWRIARPFMAGAVLGAVAGTGLVARFAFERLPLVLGVFILVVTWAPTPHADLRGGGRFVILGALQTFLSLFVGATGPMTSPFLLREGLPKDRLVITLGFAMTVIHTLKLGVFAYAGFSFTPHVPLIVAMGVAVVLGSWVGTHLRGRVSEARLRRWLKVLITALAIRMIIGALSAVWPPPW